MDIGILFLWFVMGCIGALIGQRKGRVLAGFLWGIALGPFGWLIVGLGPTIEKPAPGGRPRALR